MRWPVPIALIGISLFFGANYFVRTHLPANTFLNEFNLGLKSHQTVLNWLGSAQNPKLQVKVGARVYPFQYQDLGIIFDLNQTYRELTEESTQKFPQNIIAFLKAYGERKAVLPALVFSQEFYERVAALQFDFSKDKDKVLLSPKTKNLVYENHQELFVIDAQSLLKEILVNFGKKGVLKPQVHRVIDSHKSLKIAEYNLQLSEIFAKPVKLYADKTGLVGKLSETDLKQILLIDYDTQNEWLSVGVDREAFEGVVSSLAFSLGKDLKVDKEDFRQKLISLINSRFNGYSTDSLIINFREAPNTEGEVEAKYIEIDLSQQKMYLWEEGENIAIHRVSSGLYYPTPPGRYKILNKAENAYSYIYHVWMPYWMAFSLDPKVNAYLGIHELPYYYDLTGTEIRRPRDFIGSPHTGGCVSLDVGEAKQVYDWAKVGTPVWIFD